MSSVISKLPVERQYAFKKHPQGCEIKGADLKLVKTWKNDHNTYCELCGKGGNLLLCDYCNLSFHPSCLVPPLLSIPEVLVCQSFDLRRGIGRVLSAVLNSIRLVRSTKLRWKLYSGVMDYSYLDEAEECERCEHTQGAS